METFSARLHDALLAAGINGAADLSRRSKVSVGAIAEALRTEGESLSFRQGLEIAGTLKVRGNWLMFGRGPISPVATGDPREAEMLSAWSGLEPEKAAYILRVTRRMSGGRP